MKPLFRLIAVAALVVLTLGTATAAAAQQPTGDDPYAPDEEFADPAFEERWERLDYPVLELGVERTFWWGPGPFTEGLMEPYEQSPGDSRLVQYFDKSRMEIINPGGDPDELWYVTNGLLVVEMIQGKIQVGDDSFIDAEPAEVPVAGDPDNPYGPTYATLAERLDDEPLDQNELITVRLDREGTVTEDPALADYNVGIGNFVPETNHTVAAPFWEIMTAAGPVWVDDQLVTADLFRNPFYAIGYPVTEPFWSTALVAGEERDVLFQCFERRCLTYTPGNPEGFIVEAGNVGQHYYRWRYEDGEPQTETVEVFFILLGDEGQSGTPVGCGDSIVGVQMEIDATDDTATRIERALMALFGVNESEYGENDLYNSLYQSNLMVESVTVENGTANVDITGDVQIGGACDEPRFEEQIRQTVLAIQGIDTAVITVNGTPLDELFGPPQETETVQLYFVDIGDAGQNGMPIGCEDSLVPVDYQIQATDDTATRVERALAALFGIDTEMYDDTELYNALYQSNLSVASVTMDGNTANVEISGDVLIGGVCDEPRFVEQIRQTVLSLEGVDAANITINGTPLDEYFGQDGVEDTVQLYFINLGGEGADDTFGCGDALEAVQVNIEPTGDRATMIRRALSALFGVDTETYGDTDLYNALYQSNLTVESVSLAGNEAFVSLSGTAQVSGACDEPRFERQIRQTILGIPGIDAVNVMINDTPLDEYFGPPQETQTVQLYFVAVGDDGENGMPIGCQDSLIPVEYEIPATETSGERVLATLNELLGINDEIIDGPDGMQLTNALAGTGITAMAVDITNGLATVRLAGDVSVGGVCEEPRIVQQIRQTVLQFDAVEIANIYLNDQLLTGYFDPEELDEGVLATFDVNGELFNLWTTNQETIDQIMALQAGESQASIPIGPILEGPGPADYNLPWSWHFDPQATSMAEVTIEVCDAVPSYVEANLDYFINDVGQYCPWSAELVYVEDLTSDESS